MKWISVKDRLSKQNIVQFIAELPHKKIHKIGLWAEYKGYITHWMPLHDPPK